MLMDGLVNNHSFVDGNKRVGITAAVLFPARNGRRLAADNEEVERFTLEVAMGRLPVEEMAARFRQHTLVH